MTYERWQSLVGEIKDRFSDVNTSKADLAEGPGHKEVVAFKSPAGQVKLELIVKPRIVGRKSIYSNRIGSSTTVEYEYDTDDKVLVMRAFKFSEQTKDWEEIKTDSLLSVF